MGGCCPEITGASWFGGANELVSGWFGEGPGMADVGGLQPG